MSFYAAPKFPRTNRSCGLQIWPFSFAHGLTQLSVGRDSSVGIATGYVLDDPEIESRWGRNFSHLSRPALGPTQPPV
jgi:hypothetical protein